MLIIFFREKKRDDACCTYEREKEKEFALKGKLLLRKDPFLSSLLDERIHSCEYSKENRKERPDNESSSLSSKLSSLSIQIPDPRFLSVASDYYFSSNLYRIDSKNRFSSTLAPPILLYFPQFLSLFSFNKAPPSFLKGKAKFQPERKQQVSHRLIN